MAWTMGDKEFAALLQSGVVPQQAVAQEVANALLRSAARQAIIAAAADAVAQLSCGHGSAGLPFLVNTDPPQKKDDDQGGGIDKGSDEPETRPEPYP